MGVKENGGRRQTIILRAIAAALSPLARSRPGWSLSATREQIILRGPGGDVLTFSLTHQTRDDRFGVWVARGADASKAITSIGPRDDPDEVATQVIAPWTEAAL